MKAALSLAEWLQEREANCRQHAARNYGAEKEGWLEDAEYFKQAIAFAAPSTPAAPLRDDEIDDLWAAASDHDDGVNIHELARAVERHHGIGPADDFELSEDSRSRGEILADGAIDRAIAANKGAA